MTEHDRKSWAVASLGSIGEWRGGGTPNKAVAAFWNEGTIPWVSPKDMKVARISDAEDKITEAAIAGSSTQVVPADSVLMVTRSGILRHTFPIAVSTREVAINQDIKALTPFDGIKSDYLALQISSKQAEILGSCAKSGTTVDSIDTNALKDFAIAIAPTSEQRRIVEKIDRLSAKSKRAREQLDCVPRLIEKYKQSILSLAFQGVLTQNWRAEHPDFIIAGELPQNKQIRVRRGVVTQILPPEFVQDWRHPSEWKLAHIGKYLIQGGLIDVKDGNHGTNHPKRDEFTTSGLPFITAAQLANNKLDVASAPRLAGTPLRKLRVGFAKSEDVLLSHKGTVGRVAICTEECVLSPQATYYRSERKSFLPSFLRLQMLSPFFQRQLDEVKSQTTRDFVPISQQYELFLLGPCVAEQVEIVKQVEHALNWIDRLASEATSARKLIERLDQAVLSKAFRGELVPQDPNDEPASMLLQRIKGEKNGATQPRRGRGRPPSVARL